jgi:hypothetical protein
METDPGIEMALATSEIPFSAMIPLLDVPFDPKMVVKAVVAWRTHL